MTATILLIDDDETLLELLSEHLRAASFEPRVAGSGEEGVRRAGAADDPVAALQAFPLPVIAAINGPAVTGGFELALACDVLIGSSAARFADTHARIGVLPGWGLSQKLGVWAAEGKSLTADES